MNGRSEDTVRNVLLEPMQGKEITRTTRRLTEKDISFSEEIEEILGMLNFYMEVIFDPDRVFGTHVATTDNGDWINVYANFDMENHQVCDDLDIILHRDNGTDEELAYHLDDNEKAFLLVKMERYCQQKEGMSLEQFCHKMIGTEIQEAGICST